jgi:hypothetical protein
MGLDKDDPRPPVALHKRTTKVNIWMVVAILAFFVVAGLVTWALWQDPESSTTEAVPLPGK